VEYSTEITWADFAGLLDGQVHVYACDIATLDIKDLLPLLTKEELTRAKCFRQQADADRFSTGRVITKKLLGYYGVMDPSAIIIEPGDNGKPIAYADTPAVLPFFNISHSGNKVLIAVSNDPVGIDIEQIKNIELGVLAETVFSSREFHLFNTADNSINMFYQLWTRKEALLKSVGVGLLDDLRTLDISQKVDTDFVKAFTHQQLALLSFAMNDEYGQYFASICYPQNKPLRFIELTNELLSQL